MSLLELPLINMKARSTVVFAGENICWLDEYQVDDIICTESGGLYFYHTHLSKENNCLVDMEKLGEEFDGCTNLVACSLESLIEAGYYRKHFHLSIDMIEYHSDFVQVTHNDHAKIFNLKD